MKARLVVLALASVCCGSFGCGDNIPPDLDNMDPGPGDVPAEVTLADICNPTSGTFVTLRAKYLECFPEIAFQLGAQPTADELSALCQGSFQPILEDGSLKLGTPDDLQACRAYVESLTCDNLTPVDAPNPCQALLIGNVPEAMPCDQSVQCAGASYCARDANDTCGQCAAKLAVDAECSSSDQCQSGYCAFSGIGTQGTCRELSDVGQACTQDMDCKGTMICGEDSVCAAAPTWAEGTPCNPAELRQCNSFQTGLYCGSGGTCQKFADVGDTCAPDLPCNLFRYESCKLGPNNTRQCAAAETAELGEGCGSLQGLKCADGLICGAEDPDPSTPPVCYAPANKDESCSQPGEICGPLLVCSTDGVCEHGWYTGMCPVPEAP